MEATTAPHGPDTLSIALQYVAAGLKLLPLHSVRDGKCSCGREKCESKGKHPRLGNGAHGASNDPQIVSQWLSDWPSCNLGMTLDGYVVIDIDPRHDGDLTFDNLLEKFGSLPATATQATGGGGRHFLFKADPDAHYKGSLGKGIDLKHGAGQFVVVEPSLHASGVRYSWLDEEGPHEGGTIANAPHWLNGSKAKKEPFPTSNGKIIPGGRNQFIYEKCRRLRDLALPEDAIIAAALALNIAECSPPLEDEEVKNTARSAAQNPPEEHASESFSVPTTWPDPADLFQPVKIPVLRPEWLPEVIANYAFEVAESIGCDPAILAQSCITVCSSIAHDGIKLQPNEHTSGWKESARIWSAIVGDPSSKKSPAINRATSHLRKIDIDLFKIEQTAKARYKLEQRIFEQEEKNYISARVNPKKSSILSGEPIAPTEPVIERLMVEDITIEAMSEVLKNNPRGVMVYADELSGWLGSMDAYKAKGAGGADRANWLSIYNGGARRIDRIARGNILVPNWSACILGGIQPDMMRKIFNNMPEDGLLQRFIPIVATQGSAGEDKATSGAVIASYHHVIDRIFAYGPQEASIRLSPEAYEIHKAIVGYYYELRDLSVLPKPLLAFMGKWEGLSPRLMLVFHLIECATANENPNRPICEATAERVFWYMKEFIFGHAYAFYGDVLSDSGIADAVRWIGGYLLAHEKYELANRDLLRSYRWWSNAQDWERQQVSNRLIDLGWLAPKGGQEKFKRIPTTWAVNPKIHQAFQDIGQREKNNRQKAIELIHKNGG